MLKKLSLAICLIAGTSGVIAAPTVYPTGVTIYNTDKAWNQYVVFSDWEKSYVIDMNGHVVQSWPYKGFPTEVIDPALIQGKKGHVFVQLADNKDSKAPFAGNGVNNHSVAELDWKGNIIWQWAGEKSVGNAHQHHEISRLSNGNTLILANKIHKIAGFKLDQSVDDAIYEVDKKGKVVWRWLASEHLNEFGFTSEQLQLIHDTDHEDYLHLNNARILGENKWYDSGDVRFHPDNIIIDSRQANFIAIIDKKTGKVVWSLGPNYPKTPEFPKKPEVPRAVDQLSGLHDAKIIAKGLPGEGNILVFDNHSDAGYPLVSLNAVGKSRVVEIDPVTNQIVWEYSPSSTLFSSRTSLARRLPNGNTLITEGQTGRVFQITTEGEIVWEYVNPFFPEKRQNGFVKNNGLYRATPVPYTWVPDGTTRSEIAVIPPKLEEFKISPVSK